MEPKTQTEKNTNIDRLTNLRQTETQEQSQRKQLDTYYITQNPNQMPRKSTRNQQKGARPKRKYTYRRTKELREP